MYRVQLFGPAPPDPAQVVTDRARRNIETNLDTIMSVERVSMQEAMGALYRWYEQDLDADYYESRLLARLRINILAEMAQELFDAETALEMN